MKTNPEKNDPMAAGVTPGIVAEIKKDFTFSSDLILFV
jgi:hypothetical protein